MPVSRASVSNLSCLPVQTPDSNFTAATYQHTLGRMRYGWAMLTLLAWGLWFGGMITLFLLVSALFINDRQTAVVAAPRMFAVFERFQFVVAGTALLSAALWRLVSPARTSVSVIFALLVVAAVGLMISAIKIRPPMERLWLADQVTSPEFERLHKASEGLFACQALALLVAGVMLPVALTLDWPSSSSRRREPEVAAPTTPPVGPADRAS